MVQAYSSIKNGNTAWNELQVPSGDQYSWDNDSTYIQSPPFFETMEKELPQIKSIQNARVLLNLGDSVTTDHISPAGAISRTSPAAKYLMERGMQPKQFNRCVTLRGTFSNIILVMDLDAVMTELWHVGHSQIFVLLISL